MAPNRRPTRRRVVEGLGAGALAGAVVRTAGAQARRRRLKADYAAWDATMLPYPQGSLSESLKGRAADRY